jgi:hypothetical protein
MKGLMGEVFNLVKIVRSYRRGKLQIFYMISFIYLFI